METISEEDANKIMNIEYFKIGHNPDDTEDRLKYINDLPYWFK